MRRYGGVVLAILLWVPGIASKAFADAISFYGTGVADDGSVLAAGAVDSHYTLLQGPSGKGGVATAIAANPVWLQATDGSGWISGGTDGTSNQSSGYFVYETTLDLTGFAAQTAVLSGMLAADDSVSIYLNRTGAAVFSGSTGYAALTSFQIGGFVDGVNQVDFVVHNQSGPSGLLVTDVTATATPVEADTPEPASIVLVLTGGLAVFAARRARLPGFFTQGGGRSA